MTEMNRLILRENSMPVNDRKGLPSEYLNQRYPLIMISSHSCERLIDGRRA
jgi:hypothetical protein